MSYNFDKVINRKNTKNIKWNAELVQKWINNKNEDLLSFWVADMDYESPPAIKSALFDIVEHGVFGYSDFTEEYYDAVCSWYKRKFDTEIKKEWILYCNGIVPAINFAVQCFSNEQDKIIIQQPVYYPFSQAIVNNNRIIANNELIYKNNRYEIDFEDLENLAKDESTKIMILCSPHNPVCRVWTEDELKRILEICYNNNVLLISDEIHCDIVFGDNKHYPASAFNKYLDNLILCSSASKTFNIAGIPNANIIIPNSEIREKFKNQLAKNNILLPNIFAVDATIAAYTKSDEWLEELLKYLEGNIAFIEKFLEENIPGAKLVKPEGTYLGWIDFGENDYLKRAEIISEKAKVALDNGYIFGDCGKRFERINFACPREVLAEGLTRIANSFNEEHYTVVI